MKKKINKTASILTLLFVVIIGSNFSSPPVYIKFPASYRDAKNLVPYINPDKSYEYWEYSNASGSRYRYSRVIYNSGTKPANIKFNIPADGFFHGCMPVYCYNYIAYIYNGQAGYVTTADGFKKFLGTIDNPQEAILLAEISENNLFVDADSSKGGSCYVKNDTVYNLRLMHYQPCPETENSIYLQVQKNTGIVKRKDLGVYYKGAGCIVY